MDAKYLGDGVYISNDGYQYVLTTGTHRVEDADNKVYLDDNCVLNLLKYLKERKPVFWENIHKQQ